MEKFDVVIVGAGPAGGQIARRLSESGKKVLLTDKQHSFADNNFSSAGAPNELIEKFHLPDKVIASTWDAITIRSTNNKAFWKLSKKSGAVLDFIKLRQFLTDIVKKNDGCVRLGYSYQRHEFDKEDAIVHFKDLKNNKDEKIKARVLVDATGSEKNVLTKSLNVHPQSFPSSGIEYLVEVPENIYQKWSNTLSFFIGKKWMPQGYSWIFPMGQNRLKIGVGRYFNDKTYVFHEQSFKFYLENMLKICLKDDYSLIDKHGKKINYTYRQKDPHSYKNVIAIGDAISSINPLAFEGIRHAMATGNLAADAVHDYLSGKTKNLNKYPSKLKKYFGFKWRISEFLMNIIYKEPQDEKMDAMINALKRLTFQEIYDLTFHYKFRSMIKFLFFYYLPIFKNK